MADRPQQLDPVIALRRVGKALWHVNFCAQYIQDAPCRVPDEATTEHWAETIGEDGNMLVESVEALKQALGELPQEAGFFMVEGYKEEDEIAKARGAASILVANAQRIEGEKARDARGVKP